jgi:hypothetical protein
MQMHLCQVVAGYDIDPKTKGTGRLFMQWLQQQGVNGGCSVTRQLTVPAAYGFLVQLEFAKLPDAYVPLPLS